MQTIQPKMYMKYANEFGYTGCKSTIVVAY